MYLAPYYDIRIWADVSLCTASASFYSVCLLEEKSAFKIQTKNLTATQSQSQSFRTLSQSLTTLVLL